MPEGGGVTEGVDRGGLADVVGPALDDPAVLAAEGVVENVGAGAFDAAGEGPAGGDPLGLAGAEEVADLLATALQRVEGGGLRRAVSPAEDAAADMAAGEPVALRLPRRPQFQHLGVGAGRGGVGQVVDIDIAADTVLLRQFHGHMGHGLLQRIIDTVDVGIVALPLSIHVGDGTVKDQRTDRVAHIVGGGDGAVVRIAVQAFHLTVDPYGTGHTGDLFGGQVIEDIGRKALCQQLLADRLVLGRVIAGMPVHGIPLPQECRQQHRRQQHTQAAPQHRGIRKADRGGGDGVAGIGQRTGQSDHAAEQEDVEHQHRQDQQPALHADERQDRKDSVEHRHGTGGGGRGLLRPGGAGDTHHTPPQADIQHLQQGDIDIGRCKPRLHRQGGEDDTRAADGQRGQREDIAPAEGRVFAPQRTEAQHQQQAADGGQDHIQIQEIQGNGDQTQTPEHPGHGHAPGIDLAGGGRRQGGGILTEQIVKAAFVSHRDHLPAVGAGSAAGDTSGPPPRAPSGPARRPSGRWTGSSNTSGRTAPARTPAGPR